MGKGLPGGGLEPRHAFLPHRSTIPRLKTWQNKAGCPVHSGGLAIGSNSCRSDTVTHDSTWPKFVHPVTGEWKPGSNYSVRFTLTVVSLRNVVRRISWLISQTDVGLFTSCFYNVHRCCCVLFWLTCIIMTFNVRICLDNMLTTRDGVNVHSYRGSSHMNAGNSPMPGTEALPGDTLTISLIHKQALQLLYITSHWRAGKWFFFWWHQRPYGKTTNHKTVALWPT